MRALMLLLPCLSQTADNWGVDVAQCMYPGFGRDPLFISSNGQIAPTNYPITFDSKQACNLLVYEQNVYQNGNINMVGGGDGRVGMGVGWRGRSSRVTP